MGIIYRVDKNRGRDTNDGVTAPWANPQMFNKIKAVPAGTQLLLADDSDWTFSLNDSRLIPAVGALGTQDNPVVIGKYSPSSQSLPEQRPIIRWYTDIQPSEWVYEVDKNAWSYRAQKVNVGLLSLVLLGNGWGASTLGTEDKLPLKSIAGRYLCSNDADRKLYLYAPAGTDPTTFYGGVRLSPSSSGFITVSDGHSWMRVEDLHFEDTACGVLGYSGNSEVGLHARRISGVRVSSLISVTTDSNGQMHALIEYCKARNYGATALWAYTNAGKGMKEIEIRYNDLEDGNNCFAQGGIYYQCRSPGLQGRIHNNKISRVKHGSPDFHWDGCGIYVETGSDDVLVYDNIIRDSHLALQDNSGRKSRFFNNMIDNCKTAIVCADGMNNNLTDHTFENNTCIVGTPIAAVHGPGYSCSGWESLHSNFHGKSIRNLTVRSNVFINVGSKTLPAAINIPDIVPTVSDYTGNVIGGYDNAVALRNGVKTPSNPIGTMRLSERAGYVLNGAQ